MVRLVVPSDFKEIVSWHKTHGMSVDPSLFPKTGFIEPGIACGFIYITGTPVGFIEGYCSNPDADPHDRNEALDSITVSIIDLAKNVGIKVLKAETSDNTILLRAIRHGYKTLGERHSIVMEVK